MPARPERWATIAGLALLATLLLLKRQLHANSGEPPGGLLFVLPVVVASMLGGGRAGLIVTAAAGVAAAFSLFAHWPWQFSREDWRMFRRWLLVVACGASISCLGGIAQWARRRLVQQLQLHEQTKAALRLRNAQIVFLFEQTGVGFAECGLDGRVLRANAVLCDRLGRQAGGLDGVLLRDFTAPDDWREDERVLAQARANTLSSYRREKRYVHANGRWIWVQVTGGVLREAQSGVRQLFSVVEFIDERKEAEAQRDNAQRAHVAQIETASRVLQLNQARLASILDTVAEAIITLDGRGQITMTNRAAAELLGCTDGAINGTPMTRWLPPEHRNLVATRLRMLDRQRERNQAAPTRWAPMTLLDAQGDSLVVQAAFSTVSVQSHHLYIAVLRDIREEHAAQTALQQHRATLAAALDNMGDGLLIVDRTRQIVHMNDAFLQFHRTGDRPAFGRMFDEYDQHFEVRTASGEAMVRSQWPLERALRGETRRHVTLRFARHPGTERWIGSVSHAPIRDRAGVITGAVLTMRDTTELHAMHEELTRSEARLRSIFNSSADAVLVTDRDMLIVNANAEAADMFGLPVSALSGMCLLELAPPRHREAHAAAIEKHLLGAERVKGRAQRVAVRHASGREFPCDASWARVDLITGPVYSIILRDVSDRERAATELQTARDQLAVANTQLQQLLVSQQQVEENERKRIARELHDDLQQRLVVIRLNQEMMAASLDAHTPSGPMLSMIEQNVAVVNETMESLRRIVNDLRPQTLDLLGLPDAIDLLLRDFSRLTQIETDFELSLPESCEFALPDPVCIHLYRATQEALNNVRKHAEAGFVLVSLNLRHDRQVELTITDDGCGFDRASVDPLASNGLSGIGERAHALGGTLAVHSQCGHGTTLVLQVPMDAVRGTRSTPAVA